jgi:hypothetical protein
MLTVYVKVLPTRALPGEAVMLTATSNPLCIHKKKGEDQQSEPFSFRSGQALPVRLHAGSEVNHN